jgi:hypothetical protein
MSRRTVFLAIASASAFTLAVPSADAAMPVSGAAQVTSDSDVVLAQAKKKKSKQQKEIDSSVESGTVPKRYRSSVPKQYHHLIPFAK